ncbi:phage integrase N-terminal SAM-like domain-containing protein [Mangrovimonas sp. AS39]|uniref:tyrosine-type recombinase/integrase n=2 Tax=Mangrovimonas futianensis TaxID=2895523 RepID=UPI001E61411A|nr:phage integrase N-terminal SAM-like domain-containing protein [Mangrovimonas futianensis]MCF1192295.1 phage integrase N-terminal SAM-like domain-containing protein [Mangrovimonas futianensis]MCF1195956.1 phage integrase N-terminal SAM-like domain-containing protein [Mangrovimonas futianensis]
MSNYKDVLTFAYESEYENAYDLPNKNKFTTPKIYTAKGDLSKRWYVYFSFQNPDDPSKLKRVTPFYGKVNKFKTKEERLEVLSVYRRTLIKLLKLGYNPFDDNTSLFEGLKKNPELPQPTPAEKPKKTKTPKKEKSDDQPKIAVAKAFEFVIELKEKSLTKTTVQGYKSRVDFFLKWLKKNQKSVVSIDQLDKKIVSAFLNDVLMRTSPRNRNNYRTDLSSLLQTMEDNELIEDNFVKRIPVLKSIPKRNKTYSEETTEAIFSYLEANDPTLLLFIKFISYNLLRPIEVCRLRVKDIDTNKRTIQFKAKNSPLKTKIIPEILWKDLPDLSQMDGELFLFTPDKIGGEWQTTINNKRDYFSKRFKKVVKDHFDLGEDYGLYSFRHTFITKLYRALAKDSTPFEAKSKLLLITGHSSMGALEKYLRDIDAELPQDYSTFL